MRDILDSFELAIYAPAAPEAENNNINESANDSCEKIDKDIADSGIATNDGKLMYFVDSAIGYAEYDGINSKSNVWIFGCMESFYEARN